MNIFCCFGKGAATALSKAQPTEMGRLSANATDPTKPPAQAPEPQEASTQEGSNQTHSVFAEASGLVNGSAVCESDHQIEPISSTSDFFLSETESQLEVRVEQEKPKFPVSKNRDGNTVKYSHSGDAAKVPMQVSKNFHHLFEVDARDAVDSIGYENEQTNFDLGTDQAIIFCKEFISDNSIGGLEDLVEKLGQARADLAPNGSLDEFGVKRTNTIYTMMIGARYALASGALEATYDRRLMNADSHSIQVTDLSDLDDEEFSQIKEAFLNGKNYYVEYQPNFKLENGELLNLTSFVKAGGDGIAVHPQSKHDFYVPFDFIRDGAQDLSSVEGDFVSNLKSQRREEFAPRIGVRKVCHPAPSEVDKLFEEMGNQLANFRSAVRSDDKEQMLESGSNLAYLFCNTAPYKRGSAWAGEVIASSVMQLVTGRQDIKFTGTNLDFVAFGNSASEFKEALVHCATNVSMRPNSEKTRLWQP